MKKIKIGSRLYNVITMDEYTDYPNLNNPKNTAIEVGDVVLPLKTSSIDSGPGVYYKDDGKFYCEVEKPTDTTEYSIDNVIDYTKAKDVGDIINNNKLIRNIQNDIMATRENIFCLPIDQEDQPEMKALKMAINAKQVDKKAYEDNFDQFQNNMRLLKGHSITLAKMIEICSGFDIACKITLSDKEDVPNPMNTEISVDLTEGRRVKNEPT